MKIDKNIRIHPDINELLREIVKQRSLNSHSVVTGKGIVAELIIKAHKKECKK